MTEFYLKVLAHVPTGLESANGAARWSQADLDCSIVAHRLSTAVHSGRLYQMHEGRMVAEGAPAEMIKTKKVASPA